MKYNILIILFVIFSFQQILGQVSTENPGAIDCGNANNPIGLLSVDQSTTDGNNPPERAIDGEINGTHNEGKASKTHVEDNPYFEATLESQTVLSELSIHYPSDLFPHGMGNYYILVSDFPFENSNLSSNISSPMVESIYVDTPISSGVGIPLNNKSGKFVRIQLDGNGFISFTEIELLGIEPDPGGSGEICGNGEDDDCDGKIDCEDNDCAPVIAHVTTVQPSCPTCEDGQIIMNVGNKRESEVLYSIDGGYNFVEFNRAEEYSPDHLFDNLGEGEYNLVVKNDICEVPYVNNPVVLAATAGVLTSNCGNGDLEVGDVGWTFERYSVDRDELISRKEDDPSASFNVDFIEAFVIPTDGFVDPLVPEINGSWSALGEYTLMLGAPGRTTRPPTPPSPPEDDKNIAEFCFNVNEENQDFSFVYAPVLEDSHNGLFDGPIKPFFEYEIFVDGDSKDQRKIRSNDGFFDDGPGQIKYKGWTCVFFDLSEYIGQEACVKFTVRDCREGGHFGYVYIDGLCSDANLINPEIEILANEIFCSDESVSLTVSGGGYSSYQWKVGKLNGNNNEYDIFEFPLQESAYNASFQNVLSEYSLNSGFSEDCVTYFAELSVFGSCGTTTETIQFRRSCVDNVVDYCDYLLACTTAHDEITFQGEIDCEGCTFDWQPAGYFVDNTVALPTIQPDLISGLTDVFDRDYILTYTAPDGCDDTRTVTIGNDDGFDISIEGTHTRCVSTYTFTITFDFNINPSVVERIFAFDAAHDITDEGIFVSSTNNTLIYQIEVDRDRGFGEIQPYYYIDFDFSSLNDVCLIGENTQHCSKEGWVDPTNGNIFSKPWTILLPNVFNPYSPNLNNQTFRPFFTTVPDSNNECEEETQYEGSSIYWAKMTIYAENGAVVFEKEAEVPDNAVVGLTGREVQWDGVVRCNDGTSGGCNNGYDCFPSNGPANNSGSAENLCIVADDGGISCNDPENPECYQFYPDEVYVYILRVKSCTKETFGDCGRGFLCNPDLGNYCSEEGMEEEMIISGDVTKWSSP